MGALSSKRRELEWSWSGPPGKHSPYPVDYVPYPGPDLLYAFVDTLAHYKFMPNKVNLGHQAVTTDVEKYSDEFEDCYREGFHLRLYVKVPGVKNTTKVQDWGEEQPYQAIFTRFSKKKEDLTKEWRLHIEKCIMSTKTLHSADEGCDSLLLQKIREFTDQGARLMAAEPIGYVRSTTANMQYSVMGVNMFFNMPQTASPCIWQYHMIRVCTRYTVVPDSTQSVQQIECDADWMGQLKAFLDQGWKLVDICMDTTALADAFGMKAASRTIDTIWLFEKEDSKMNDLTAKYEGVIIEYIHKVKTRMNGEMPCRDWRPVIAGMGLSGWELATIVQTPLLVQSGFTKYTLKLLMVFQRRLHPEHRKATEEYIRNYQLQQRRQNPLGYYRQTTTGGSYSTLPANHHSTLRDSPGSSALSASPRVRNQQVRFPDEQSSDASPRRPNAYYNHTLGRYVYPAGDRIDEEDGGDGAAAAGGFIANGIPPGSELQSSYTSPSLGPIVRGKR